jgi:hypothetical protein
MKRKQRYKVALRVTKVIFVEVNATSRMQAGTKAAQHKRKRTNKEVSIATVYCLGTAEKTKVRK